MLEEHNMKEEQILYPQADAMRDPGVREAVLQQLQDGELPAGWVCERLRIYSWHQPALMDLAFLCLNSAVALRLLGGMPSMAARARDFRCARPRLIALLRLRDLAGRE